MCERDGLTFLGGLPVDTDLVDILDASVEYPPTNATTSDGDRPPVAPLVQRYQTTASSKLMKPVVETIISSISQRT